MRKLLIVGSLVILCLLVILWMMSREWVGQKNTVPSPSVSSTTAREQSLNAQLETNGKIETKPDRVERLRQAMEEANANIHFYGKVVDQNGQPLEGVRVLGGARRGFETLPGQFKAGEGASRGQSSTLDKMGLMPMLE